MVFGCAAGTTTGHTFHFDDFSAETEPEAPTGLMAAGLSPERADVAWLDVWGETGYSVERRPAGSGTWTELDTTNANTCGLSDTSVAADTSYNYRVIATNALGDSDPSSTGPSDGGRNSVGVSGF